MRNKIAASDCTLRNKRPAMPHEFDIDPALRDLLLRVGTATLSVATDQARIAQHLHSAGSRRSIRGMSAWSGRPIR